MKSMLPGTVSKILVKVGDKVSKGQVLVIIESMKMENEMECDVDGAVKEILVNESDHVVAGQDLLVIE